MDELEDIAILIPEGQPYIHFMSGPVASQISLNLVKVEILLFRFFIQFDATWSWGEIFPLKLFVTSLQRHLAQDLMKNIPDFPIFDDFLKIK